MEDSYPRRPMRCWHDFLHASAAALIAACLWAGTALASEAAALEGRAVQESASDVDLPRFHAQAPRPKDDVALFELFASLEGLEVDFVEEKHLKLLFEPLTSRGKLYFLRPGRLARVVEKPRPSTVIIGPEELKVRGDGGEEVIDLRQNEAVRVFVTSLVRVFSGDRDELLRYYEIEYLPAKDDAQAWTLQLVPRETIVPKSPTKSAGAGPPRKQAKPEANPLAQMVRRLRLSGTGTVVDSIEIDEPSGDRTVTRITASNAARTFTDEEKHDLFDLTPSSARR